jgi:Leucine-rich repeat (LRR) protein
LDFFPLPFLINSSYISSFLVCSLLQNNVITGPIPDEIGNLATLKTLDLSNNRFYGEIPPSVGHLESLQYL